MEILEGCSASVSHTYYFGHVKLNGHVVGFSLYRFNFITSELDYLRKEEIRIYILSFSFFLFTMIALKSSKITAHVMKRIKENSRKRGGE